jgi:hypothetical protein
MFVGSVKDFRKQIDAAIQKAEQFLGDKSPNGGSYGREMSLVRTKLQEAKMWAGKVLEAVGNPFPAELADKADVQ